MKISDIILWILFIISIFVAIWYLIGDSPTFEQAILIMIVTFLFTINNRMSKVESRLYLLEKSFSYLAKDFKQYVH